MPPVIKTTTTNSKQNITITTTATINGNSEQCLQQRRMQLKQTLKVQRNQKKFLLLK